MPHFLLQLETPYRTADIVFESDSEQSAIGDMFIHAHHCKAEPITHTMLYPVTIGRLVRSSGLFETVVGDAFYDSDADDEGESTTGLEGAGLPASATEGDCSGSTA